MTINDPLSPIRLQLMWDRLIAVVEEQAQTLIRTGFSTSTREAGDLSAGVFDFEAWKRRVSKIDDSWKY